MTVQAIVCSVAVSMPATLVTFLTGQSILGRQHLAVSLSHSGVAEFIASAAPPSVRVRSSDQHALAGLLRSPGVTVTSAEDGALAVSGLTAEQIGTAAATAGITVLELSAVEASLEDAFVDLTRDAVEFRAVGRPAAGPSSKGEI